MRKATRTAAVLALVATCIAIVTWLYRSKYVVDQAVSNWESAGGGVVDSSLPFVGPRILQLVLPNDLIDDNLRRLNYGAKRVFSLPNCQELVVSWRIDGIEQAMPTTHQLKQLNAVLEDVPVHSVHLHFGKDKMVKIEGNRVRIDKGSLGTGDQ